MLKKVFWLISIITFVLLLPMALSVASRFQKPHLGLIDNRLPSCPASPNCICSEYPDSASFTPPLSFRDDPDDSWQLARKSIIEMGGRIVLDDKQYLHAIFTSRFFRFTDDLELRRDNAQGVIHMRSASRIGYSDLGINRKRIETLRSLYAMK